MACVFNGTYTFASGTYNDSSVPSLDYSNYNVIFNGEQLNFIDTIRADESIRYIFAKGGSVDDPIFPAIAIVIGFGIGAFTAEGDYDGEATISICEKEPGGSCPDAPLADSIPEKYADYIDENGNFVPKESSGGGDCDVTLATLTLKTLTGNETYDGNNDFVSLITSDGETYFARNSDSDTGNYVIPLYKGSAIINFSLFDQSKEIEIESGDIELIVHEDEYWSYKLMGDATLILPYGGNT